MRAGRIVVVVAVFMSAAVSAGAAEPIEPIEPDTLDQVGVDEEPPELSVPPVPVGPATPNGDGPPVDAASGVGPAIADAAEHLVRPAPIGRGVEFVGPPVVIDIDRGGVVVAGGRDVRVSLGTGERLTAAGNVVPADAVVARSERAGSADPITLVATAVSDERTAELGLIDAGLVIERSDDGSEPVVVTLEFDVTELVAGRSMDFVHRLRFAVREDCPSASDRLDAEVDSYCVAEDSALEFDERAGVVRAEVLLPGRVQPSIEPAGPVDPAPEPPDQVVETPADVTGPEVDVLDPEAPTDSGSVPVDPAGSESVATGEPGTPLGFSGGSAGRVRPAPRSGSGSGTIYYGLTAGFSSDWGSYAATPLSAHAGWSVGMQAGSFDWSYPIPMVPTGWGAVPGVSLSYSSSAVDGVTSDENTQSALGHGWGVNAGGYIERSYRTCSSDTSGGWIINDFCWWTSGGNYEWLTLVLNGRVSELVPIGTNQWRLKDDPLWRVVKHTGLATSPDAFGDWFEVTTPDGTRYQFGSRSEFANSTWTVPVFANQSNEPGYTTPSSSSWDYRGWRFNLDRIIDVNDNRVAFNYVAETNRYAAHGNSSWVHEYDRGGHLAEILYGINPSAGRTTPTARVVFELRNRCTSTSSWHGCAWNLPGSTSTPDWLDVPTDLECSGFSCSKFAPSFFTKKVLTSITTQWSTNGSSWTDVDQINLKLEWPDVDGTGPIPAQLWLREISRVGRSASPNLTLPAIRFESYGGALDNRADSIFMPIWRVNTINDEFGGSTIVTYSPAPSSCNQPSAGWDSNTQRCFPRWTTLGNSSGFGAFNKYLVNQVERRDLRNASPSQFWTYSYIGNPGWHHDDNPVTNPTFRIYNFENGSWAWRNKDISTWSDWRGYGTVRETFGASAETKTVTEYRFFQGMNGDLQDSGAPPRVATVTNGVGTVFTDHDYLAGRVYDVRTLQTVSPYVVARYELTDYWVQSATSQSWIVRPESTLTRVRTNAGSYLESKVSTTYTTTGFPVNEVDHGSLSTTADDRCTRTTYATDNTTAWLRGFASRATVRAGTACTSGTVLADTLFYFDGAAHGSAPAKGNVTRELAYSSTSSSASTYYTYDAAGRVTLLNAPLTANDTNYYYDAPHGLATRAVNAAGHTTTTAYHSGRGVPTTVTDPNNKVTTLTHDALGRLTQVKHHNESQPAVTYTYLVSKTTYPYVKTSVRQSSTTVLDSWVYYDGLGQPIESQRRTPSSASSMNVATVGYDSRGNVVRSVPDFTWGNAPGLGPAGFFWNPIVSEDIAAHDSLGRPTLNRRRSYGTTLWETQVSYDGYTTTVLSPHGTGVTPTRRSQTIVDARGNVVEVRDYGTSTTAFRKTNYGYDRMGRMTTIVDHLGHQTTMNYDFLGRVLSVSDPNAGLTTNVYDSVGNVTTVTSPLGTVWRGYDTLGRMTARRVGSSSGALLGRWVYDATGEKGLLNYSESWDGAGARIMRTDTTGYDNRNRPTGVTYTVDSRAGWTSGTNPLAGSYSFGFGYDMADHRTQLSYPAAGGLYAETVNIGYNATGQAATLIGDYRYVKASTFDAHGRLASRQINDVSGTAIVTKSFQRHPGTRRLTRIEASADLGGMSGLVQRLDLGYDTAGNVTWVDDLLINERRCATYDQFDGLDRALTVDHGGSCTGSLGGPIPYDDDYDYDDIGRITNGPAGTGYQYSPGRPHAATSVNTSGGTDTYTYDNTGNRLTWTDADGPDHTYTWDILGRLTSETAGTSTTSNLYDHDRQRVLRKDPNGTVTLYLGGHLEIRRSAGGSQWGTRFYRIDGELIGIRNPAVNEWFLPDHQGSVHTTMDYATGNLMAAVYTPYGKRRGETVPGPSTERRFLGEITDPTGLSYLNNRYHDPLTGQFISVDPMVTSTGEPYIYGSANPITLSDPSGLCSSFSMNAKGDWTCTFYTRDDGSRSVDNQGGDLCNRGARICSVDQGTLPADYVFGDQKPAKYRGIPTSLLAYEAPEDPFDRLSDEVWEHRRGILQGVGVVGGAACVYFTGGFGTPVCTYGGAALAGANVAQSAQDNLTGDAPCAGDFATDVVVNLVSAGSGFGQVVPADQLAYNAISYIGNQLGGFVSSVLDSCP